MKPTQSLLDPSVELYLTQAVRDRMYGSIELKFEAGNVVLVRRTETIKPSNCRDSRDSEV